MKRGQAAMEYLMTYGWALLVIVIVLGALVYMGVLNPQGMVPETCNLQAGLMCNVLSLSKNSGSNNNGLTLTLEISNHLPVNMEDVQLGCALPGEQPNYGSSNNLNTGSTSKFTCNLDNYNGNLGDTVNMDIYLQYEVSGVKKTIKGTAVAKVSS